MNENNNSYYVNNINNKINTLDLKKQQYEEQITQKNQILKSNNINIQKLKFKNDLLKDQYKGLLRLLGQQGIMFEISLSEYIPEQWENLFIVKASKGYEIKTKTGKTLKMLQEDISNIIQDIEEKESYSLIVIRSTNKVALVQLRFV